MGKVQSCVARIAGQRLWVDLTVGEAASARRVVVPAPLTNLVTERSVTSELHMLAKTGYTQLGKLEHGPVTCHAEWDV